MNKFDVLFEQLITELFDTKAKVRWSVPKDEFGNFKAIFTAPNGKKFRISLLPTQWETFDEEEIYQGFEGSDDDFDEMFGMHYGSGLPRSYTVEFADESGTKSNFDITGEGSASAIYGIVINAMSDLVAKRSHIKHLFFMAKEPSRRSLYSRLAPILAKKGGFRINISKNKEFYYLSRD